MLTIVNSVFYGERVKKNVGGVSDPKYHRPEPQEAARHLMN